MPAKPTTIDDYVAASLPISSGAHGPPPDDSRCCTQSEECISYGIPAFKQNGMLVGLGATKNHCAFYLMSSTVLDSFQDEVGKYDQSKGTIRFAADRPLPAVLVKKLVKARLAENDAVRPVKNGKTQNGKAKRPAKAGTPTADEVVTTLKKMASKKVRDGMARFAIPTDNALGISVGDLRKVAKPLYPNHSLALDLWKTGIYEARILASLVDDPAEVTSAQMDQWCRDFDNWAVCDSACFCLFDRTQQRWGKPRACGPKSNAEFIRRGAFALIWGMTVHDKETEDDRFLDALTLIEEHAEDDRNFVKKAVNMALRAIGKRNARLHAAALVTAQRLADSTNPTARWNGKDALRELKGASVANRLSKKAKKATGS